MSRRFGAYLLSFAFLLPARAAEPVYEECTFNDATNPLKASVSPDNSATLPAKGTIEYVNGELRSNIKHYKVNDIFKECVVGDFTVDHEITVGHCPMTGRYYDGAIDDLRTTAGVVAEDEIRSNAEKIRTIAQNNTLSRMVESGVKVFAPTPKQDARLLVQLVPKESTLSPKLVALPPDFTIVATDDAMRKEAARVLASNLAVFLGIDAARIGLRCRDGKDSDAAPSSGTVIELTRKDGLRAEGYCDSGGERE